MNNAKEAFVPTIIGVMFSFVTLVLLIASQIKQNWILYEFVLTGPIQYGLLTIQYEFTTTADIGIWNFDFSTVSVYTPNVPNVLVNGTITGTKDSSTSGYFSEGNKFT